MLEADEIAEFQGFINSDTSYENPNPVTNSVTLNIVDDDGPATVTTRAVVLGRVREDIARVARSFPKLGSGIFSVNPRSI